MKSMKPKTLTPEEAMRQFHEMHSQFGSMCDPPQNECSRKQFCLSCGATHWKEICPECGSDAQDDL